MEKRFTGKSLLWIILIVTFCGITLDIYNHSPGGNVFKGLSNFKFFTLQANALILIYSFTALFLKKLSDREFFKKALGPITSYIMLTGFVYLIILEPIYELYGMERLSSTLLHYISPPLMFIYWIYTEKRRYSYDEFLRWMTYPMIFMVWGLFRAIVLGDYLYPFFDTSLYGVYVSIYLFLVSVGFSCMILLFIFINNNYLTNKRRTKKS